MKRTPNVLVISLEELRRILEYAENRAQYDSMNSAICIEHDNGRISIIQYCAYAECNPIDHTYTAKNG
jgi:hypothetical protein